MKHFANPTRGNTTLHLVFILGLPNADTSMLNNFPDSDHKMFSSFLRICPRPQNSATTTQFVSVSYRSADWSGFTATRRNLDWSDCFLPSGSQKAAGILHANWRSIIKNVTARSAQSRTITISEICKYERLNANPRLLHITEDKWTLERLCLMPPRPTRYSNSSLTCLPLARQLECFPLSGMSPQ